MHFILTDLVYYKALHKDLVVLINNSWLTGLPLFSTPRWQQPQAAGIDKIFLLPRSQNKYKYYYFLLVGMFCLDRCNYKVKKPNQFKRRVSKTSINWRHLLAQAVTCCFSWQFISRLVYCRLRPNGPPANPLPALEVVSPTSFSRFSV